MSDPKTTLTPQESRNPTNSERFAANVAKQFEAQVGNPLKLSEYENTLAQHLFIKIDASLKEFDAKRKDDRTPYTWDNVNMTKLALDAVDRVRLGLDALIPGHLYPICYFNSKLKKYDVDLRVGYKGELFFKTNAAVVPPKAVRIELVYESDTFEVYKKGRSNDTEGYEFKINKPFSRGKVVGGFGYIEYQDQSLNELVIISLEEMEKSRLASQAPNGEFWGKWLDEMYYKTLVHKVSKKLTIDPRKINVAAFARVEDQDETPLPDSNPALEEAEQNQNSTPLQLDDEDAYVSPVNPPFDNGTDDLELPLQQAARQAPTSSAAKPARRPSF